MRRSARLAEKIDPAVKKAAVLKEPVEERVLESVRLSVHHPPVSVSPSSTKDDDPTVGESVVAGPGMRSWVSHEDTMLKSIQGGYASDVTLSKVLANPTQHRAFTLRDGLIYIKNHNDDEVLCIPRAKHGKRALPELVMD